ncbi:MAG: NUDIX domain-containing protein [Aliidiomarina sp.]|uniref:NUDIX hydrolase n=1 Tax=Aliidiomarina sp. TaxID=1872439 RepID=UPI0025BA6801|nr:NUDIX domain-containing protein [Aliidiomarina sp.]MCH8501332.1 NUDIX domain-containing protein [Aliidiomarina sp.]
MQLNQEVTVFPASYHLVHETLDNELLFCQKNLPVIQQSYRVLQRQAARAVVCRHDKILLLYTERYDDFSFPGGGVDPGESLITGLRRELQEETGAQDIQVIAPVAQVTEFTPTWKREWDLLFQTSSWFECKIGETLAAANLEHYEVSNGMRAQWISVADALTHNRRVIAQRPTTMGLSIHRETLVLEQIAKSRY